MGFFQNPLAVMGVGGFLAVLGVITYFYLKARGFSLSMFMGAEQQQMLFVRPDLRLAKRNLDIFDTVFVVDHRAREAWFLDPEALYEVEEGRMEILVSRDSAIPYYPGESNKFREEKAALFKRVRTTIAEGQCDKALAEVEEEGKKDRVAETAQVLVLGLGAVIAVVVLAGLLSSNMMPWA
jgi:hypothetical protein